MSNEAKKHTKARKPGHQAEGTDCQRRKLRRTHRRSPAVARSLAMSWGLITWYDNNARHWRTLCREKAVA